MKNNIIIISVIAAAIAIIAVVAIFIVIPFINQVSLSGDIMKENTNTSINEQGNDDLIDSVPNTTNPNSSSSNGNDNTASSTTGNNQYSTTTQDLLEEEKAKVSNIITNNLNNDIIQFIATTDNIPEQYKTKDNFAFMLSQGTPLDTLYEGTQRLNPQIISITPLVASTNDKLFKIEYSFTIHYLEAYDISGIPPDRLATATAMIRTNAQGDIIQYTDNLN